MRTSALLEPDLTEADAVIASNPLAQLISFGNAGLTATPLPLILERVDGRPSLLGHFARTNPQVAALEVQPEALAIFMGPNGYVSPSWFTDRTQAPTWNYMTLHLQVRVSIDRSRAAAREAVDKLTAHMEQGRPRAWRGTDMGDRYNRLLPGVVAFRAEVLHVEAKLKLGQNDRADILNEALAGLADSENHDLASAMRRANATRLGQPHSSCLAHPPYSVA